MKPIYVLLIAFTASLSLFAFTARCDTLVWLAPWEEPIDSTYALMHALQYESAAVAWDTVQELYVDPRDGVSYGQYTPAGSWPVEFWAGLDDQIAVPIGPGVVAHDWKSAMSILWGATEAFYGDGGLAATGYLEDVKPHPAAKPVPEPSSLILLAISLVLVGLATSVNRWLKVKVNQ